MGRARSIDNTDAAPPSRGLLDLNRGHSASRFMSYNKASETKHPLVARRHRRQMSLDAEKSKMPSNTQPEEGAVAPLRHHTRDVPGSTEMYGFVSWILSALTFGVYLAWAYIPDRYLEAVGIGYRPSKYWAVALPAWLCMTFLTYILVAMAMALNATEPLNSEFTITD